MSNWNFYRIFASVIALLFVGTSTAEAARYAAIVHQAQSQLVELEYDPGVLDGIKGRQTARAIRAYQLKNGLAKTGKLDDATLASLSIGVSVDLVHNIEDWRSVPTQEELDQLLTPTNDPSNAYADYRSNAPAANLDLPGQAVLEAMNRSADIFRSRRKGLPNYSEKGYKLLVDCLKTKHYPDHWSDIALHYYCQMSLPRICYTKALAGISTGGEKFARPRAYAGCADGSLPEALLFKWVVSDQPLIFQYLMFAQTHAFNHEQEQAIINAFYGVTNPKNRKECRNKRPRRTEDPTNGTHCLVFKKMRKKLVGRSR